MSVCLWYTVSSGHYAATWDFSSLACTIQERIAQNVSYWLTSECVYDSLAYNHQPFPLIFLQSVFSSGLSVYALLIV